MAALLSPDCPGGVKHLTPRNHKLPAIFFALVIQIGIFAVSTSSYALDLSYSGRLTTSKGRVTGGTATISDDDIASGANIADSKLATITTPGKVSGNAISGGSVTASLNRSAANV